MGNEYGRICQEKWNSLASLDSIRLKTLKFIKAVSDTIFDIIYAAYYDKPLIFIRAIRLSLSRLFLTLYLIWQILLIMTSL